MKLTPKLIVAGVIYENKEVSNKAKIYYLKEIKSLDRDKLMEWLDKQIELTEQGDIGLPASLNKGLKLSKLAKLKLLKQQIVDKAKKSALGNGAARNRMLTKAKRSLTAASKTAGKTLMKNKGKAALAAAALAAAAAGTYAIKKKKAKQGK